jgi:signal transduction histidine kinase
MVFATVVVLLSVPLFYIISYQLYLHETDEALKLQHNEFQILYANKLTKNDIKLFNELNRDIEIQKLSDTNSSEKIFTKSYYNALEKENEPYRFITSPIKIDGETYLFSSKINLVDSIELLYGILALFIVIIIILVVGLFYITKRLSLNLWQPFYQTVNEIENFEIDSNAKTSLTENNVEEFSRLNTALHKLVSKNRTIYQSQTEFIENAAHELQTPIAIFKTKIDNLLQQENNSETQFKLLEEINLATFKLQKLNKNMLLLSKIGSNNYADHEEIDFEKLIIKQLPFFKEQAKSQNIEIVFKINAIPKIQANLFLTEIILRNLLSNAINHNKFNGIVEIILEENTITISNTGSTIALQQEKLYQRFTKAATATNGNGLGLAIVKQSIENLNWSISYYFENSLHHFVLKF